MFSEKIPKVELHFYIFKIKLQLTCLTIYISTLFDKLGGWSHDELRAVTSTLISISHRTSSLDTVKVENKEMDQDRILKHSRVNDTLTI